MSEVFLTADTHFGHHLMTSKRGFDSDDEMDEALIENWNATVGRTDTVYHLGDFSFMPRSEAEVILSRLNGAVHLIEGNHDKGNRVPTAFMTVRNYADLKLPLGGGRFQHLVLFHYPMAEWAGAWSGAWHAHGHCHGSMPEASPPLPRIDVGVDCWGLRPVPLPEVARVLSERRWHAPGPA